MDDNWFEMEDLVGEVRSALEVGLKYKASSVPGNTLSAKPHFPKAETQLGAPNCFVVSFVSFGPTVLTTYMYKSFRKLGRSQSDKMFCLPNLGFVLG